MLTCFHLNLFQLTKDPDGGYPSDCFTYPKWDPMEQRERAISSLTPLALAKDQEAVITQALEEV